MFSIFVAMAKDLGYATETMELRKHRIHVPLLLAESLGQVRMQQTKFNVQYRNLLHDGFSGKV